MRKNASLAAAAVVLFASVLSAHATTIAPGVDLNLTSGTSNVAFVGTVPGTFVASDSLNSVTVVFADVPGVADTFAVTDVCLRLAVLGGCPTYNLSIADANAGLVSIGAGLSSAALADTTVSSGLANIKLDGSLGATVETLTFALPAPAPSGTSPVPEPGTLGLMASGFVSAAGLLRRRLRG